MGNPPDLFNRNHHYYHLSMWTNCFPGICGGLMSWLSRCTEGALFGMRHIVSSLPLYLVIILVTLNGIVNPITPALSMTHASVLALAVFPQLSLPVCPYCFLSPSPCTLGQQVTTYWFAYCFVYQCLLIVQTIASLYTIVLDSLLFSGPYCLSILIVITYTYYW